MISLISCLPASIPPRYWIILVVLVDMIYTALVFPFNEAWRISGKTDDTPGAFNAIYTSFNGSPKWCELPQGPRSCLISPADFGLDSWWTWLVLIMASIFLLDVFINLHTPYLLRYKNDKL